MYLPPDQRECKYMYYLYNEWIKVNKRFYRETTSKICSGLVRNEKMPEK